MPAFLNPRFVSASVCPGGAIPDLRPRAVLLIIFVSAVLLLSLVAPPPAGAARSLERAAVAKLNAARRAHGLPPLVVGADLRRAAQRHTAAMVRRNRLYHSDLSRISRSRVSAENVGYGMSVGRIQRAFMRSRPHRGNVLNRRMAQVGIAVRNIDGNVWITQIYRQPR